MCDEPGTSESYVITISMFKDGVRICQPQATGVSHCMVEGFWKNAVLLGEWKLPFSTLEVHSRRSVRYIFEHLWTQLYLAGTGVSKKHHQR